MAKQSHAKGRKHPTGSFASSVCHSVTILAILIAQFRWGGLTEDPVTCMTRSAIVLGLVQLAYCLISLETFQGTPSGKNGSKKSLPAIETSSKISTAILATILSVAVSTFVFVLLIIFGAPGSAYFKETALCAVHVSLLSTQPLFYVYNMDSKLWAEIFALTLPLNSIYASSVSTWIGLWLGAIPIPLDWDRPWQQWPITLLVGAYVCSAIGGIVGAALRLAPSKTKSA